MARNEENIMKDLELGDWVTITHYYRQVEREGYLCWECKKMPRPRRGVWIGSRDIVDKARYLWTGSGLRPLEGALEVQVVAVDKDHMPMWAPIESLEKLEE